MVYRRTKVSRTTFSKLPKYAVFALQSAATTDLVKVSRRAYIGNGAGETVISSVATPVVVYPLVHTWQP